MDMHFGYALTNLLIAAQQSVHSPSAGCAVLSAGAGEGSSAFSPLLSSDAAGALPDESEPPSPFSEEDPPSESFVPESPALPVPESSVISSPDTSEELPSPLSSGSAAFTSVLPVSAVSAVGAASVEEAAGSSAAVASLGSLPVTCHCLPD